MSPGDAADRVFATGKDPLNINGLPGGFDWRKGVHDKMIASDPGQDIKRTPGATGQWFRDQSLTHKEYFVSGRDLLPGDTIEYTNRYLRQVIAQTDAWMKSFNLNPLGNVPPLTQQPAPGTTGATGTNGTTGTTTAPGFAPALP